MASTSDAESPRAGHSDSVAGGPVAGGPVAGEPAAGGPVKHVCFRLRGQEYAADIADIKETMLVLPITRVFLTPPWLSGIINLRGDIVAVIDLAQFVGLPATAVTDSSRIVICQHGGKVAGIAVDEMAELRAIDPKDIEPAPPTVAGVGATLLSGVVTVAGGAPVRVLDIGKMFESERLRAFQRRAS